MKKKQKKKNRGKIYGSKVGWGKKLTENNNRKKEQYYADLEEE